MGMKLFKTLAKNMSLINISLDLKQDSYKSIKSFSLLENIDFSWGIKVKGSVTFLFSWGGPKTF